MRIFHNHPDNPAAKPNFFMPRDTGEVDADLNPIIAYDLPAEDTSGVNSCLRSLKRKCFDGVVELQMHAEHIEIWWNNVLVAKADLVGEVFKAGSWRSQTFSFADANLTKINDGTFRAVTVIDIPALSITNAVFGLEWSFGQGFSSKQTFYLDVPGELVRIKWRTEVRTAALAENREDGKGLRYNIDDYVGVSSHNAPVHPDPAWAYNIFTFEPDGFQVDPADGRTPVQRYQDQVGLLIDPYLSVDEQATYIDVECDGYTARVHNSNTGSSDYIEFFISGIEECKSRFAMTENLEALHFDPDAVLEVIESTPTRVVLCHSGNYKTTTQVPLSGSTSTTHRMTFYPDKVFLDVEWIVGSSINAGTGNAYQALLSLDDTALTSYADYYENSGSEAAASSAAYNLAEYLLVTATETNGQLILLYDSTGLIQQRVVDNAGIRYSFYAQTVPVGTHKIVGCLIIDSASREGSAKAYNLADRLTLGTQYHDITSNTNLATIDTYGDLVTDLNIPHSFGSRATNEIFDTSHLLATGMDVTCIFNETSGDAIDHSGNSNDLTNYGGEQSIDGITLVAANTDYLRNSSLSGVNIGTGDFTVFAKISGFTSAGSQDIVSFGTYDPVFYIHGAADKLQVYDGNDKTLANTSLTNETDFTIAFVRRSGVLYYYVNGQPDGSFAYTDSLTTTDLWVGSYDGTSENLDATIEALYIYSDRGLTDNEMELLHGQPFQMFSKGFASDGATHTDLESSTYDAKLAINQTEINRVDVLHEASVRTGDGTTEHCIFRWDCGSDTGYKGPSTSDTQITGSRTGTGDYTTDGVQGKCYDNVATSTNYIRFANTSNDIINPQAGVLSFDFNVQTAGTDWMWIAYVDGNNEIYAYTSSTDIVLRYRAGGTLVTMICDTNLITGEWYHLDFVWADSNNGSFVQLWINGDLINSTIVTTAFTGSPSYIYFGSNATGTANSDALYDNVRGYSAPILPYGTLIPANVESDYSDAHSDILEYWDMESTTTNIGGLIVTLPDADGTLEAAAALTGTSGFRNVGDGARAEFTTPPFTTIEQGAVGLWVKPSAADITASRYFWYIEDPDHANRADNNIEMYVDTNERILFMIKAQGAQYYCDDSVSPQYVAGKWMYALCKWWSNGDMALWINGQLVGSRTGARSTIVGTLDSFGVTNDYWSTYGVAGDYDCLTISDNPNTPQLPFVLGSGPIIIPKRYKNGILQIPGTDYQVVALP